MLRILRIFGRLYKREVQSKVTLQLYANAFYAKVGGFYQIIEDLVPDLKTSMHRLKKPDLLSQLKFKLYGKSNRFLFLGATMPNSLDSSHRL